MAQFPRKPKKGDKVLQALYNSIIQIIDYLPSLELRGDGKTTSVTHSSAGTIVHAINQTKNLPQKKVEGGGEYYGDNISITLNGQVFSIKPPTDQTKNYALCWIVTNGVGNYTWVPLEPCD